jgi:hypothetical protein
MTIRHSAGRRRCPERTPRALATVAAIASAAAASATGSARADVAAPVDVALREPSPPRRTVAIEWDPVDLLIARIALNVEIAPADHHAIVLSPFYFYPRTSSFTNNSGAFVESQTFDGFGGELGYRFYSGVGGLRGFYVGPSVFLLFPKATAGNGAHTSFTDYGAALDVGYQALVVDAWSIGLGAGVQYTWTSESIPRQQMPATVVANRGVQPRIDFAIGYAF